MFKVTIDKEKCIGCGACVAVCDNLEIKDDGKAHPKKTEVEKPDCNKEAVDICPVQAIEVKEM
ncbi:MAG: ferredoxin [Candidatus Aenigmarchaeota archaeon]|nr:ferredoxin [Candidatus Aenigmarchaeota archaeon]